jgi:hypothetical protein
MFALTTFACIFISSNAYAMQVKNHSINRSYLKLSYEGYSFILDKIQKGSPWPIKRCVLRQQIIVQRIIRKRRLLLELAELS